MSVGGADAEDRLDAGNVQMIWLSWWPLASSSRARIL